MKSLARRRRGTRAAAAVTLLFLGAAAGCASAPAPPPEPAVAPPEEVRTPEPGAEARPEVREAPTPVPPRPWVAPAVRLSPEAPQEGRPLLVRVRPFPSAREVLHVEGELLDAPVRFARDEEGWFGVAGPPVESAGRHRLTLRYRVAPDSTVEEVRVVEVAERRYPETRLRVAARFTRPPPEVAERIARERERIRSTLERATGEWLAADGFGWPRPHDVTSPFGQRRTFNGELQSRHLGLDLRGAAGAPVRAAGTGRVALAGDFYFQGKAVFVDHGLGVYTAYFHLSRIEVADGDAVERGEVVGRVGATGRVTGPHLHWALYVAGRNVDPSTLPELTWPRPASVTSGTGEER